MPLAGHLREEVVHTEKLTYRPEVTHPTDPTHPLTLSVGLGQRVGAIIANGVGSGPSGVCLTSIGRWALHFGPVLVCWGEVHVPEDIRRGAVVVPWVPRPLVPVAQPEGLVAPRQDLQKSHSNL